VFSASSATPCRWLHRPGPAALFGAPDHLTDHCNHAHGVFFSITMLHSVCTPHPPWVQEPSQGRLQLHWGTEPLTTELVAIYPHWSPLRQTVNKVLLKREAKEGTVGREWSWQHLLNISFSVLPSCYSPVKPG
jgi:hypothetical protein